MRRRDFLTTSAALTTGNLLWSSATHASTGHNAYFSKLNDTLKRDGPGRPVMLLDTARMNHNDDLEV